MNPQTVTVEGSYTYTYDADRARMLAPDEHIQRGDLLLHVDVLGNNTYALPTEPEWIGHPVGTLKVLRYAPGEVSDDSLKEEEAQTFKFIGLLFGLGITAGCGLLMYLIYVLIALLL